MNAHCLKFHNIIDTKFDDYYEMYSLLHAVCAEIDIDLNTSESIGLVIRILNESTYCSRFHLIGVQFLQKHTDHGFKECILDAGGLNCVLRHRKFYYPLRCQQLEDLIWSLDNCENKD